MSLLLQVMEYPVEPDQNRAFGPRIASKGALVSFGADAADGVGAAVVDAVGVAEVDAVGGAALEAIAGGVGADATLGGGSFCAAQAESSRTMPAAGRSSHAMAT